MRFYKKKIITVVSLCLVAGIAQTFAQQEQHKHHDVKPTNLQVLSKDITVDSLINVMHEYSHSLGVKCGYCHASKTNADGKTEIDFASDALPEKQITRDMMRMTAAINKDYLTKMGTPGHPLDAITCVTCHRGSPHPMVSVDSLINK